MDSNDSKDEGQWRPPEAPPVSDDYGPDTHERRGKTIIVGVATVLVLLLVAAAVLVWWLKRAAQAPDTKEPVEVSVQVAKAETESISAQVTSLGTIFPRDKSDVAAKISAQIKQMALLKNKLVHAGDVIAVLESRDLQAQRREAQATLNEALASQRSVTTGTIPQTNAQDQKALRDARAKVRNTQAIYDRRRALFAQGGISQKDLEASELDLTTAQDELRLAEQTITLRAASLNPNDRALAAAKVEEAQQHLATLDSQLSYATIRAPITGIVTDQFQYQGEFAASGAKLFTIADMSHVIVKANFADTVAAQVKVGDTATVLPTDTGSEEMHGQITLVSRATDPASRTVEVWVTLANGGGQLRANGAAQVTVSTKSKNDAVVIPAAAVTLDASNASEGTVMLVDEKSVAHEQKVSVGIRSGDKIEITSGVKDGDTVVIEGNYALPDGTKVKSEEKPDKEDKKEDTKDSKEEKDEKP